MQNYLINILGYFIFYISIPIAIRYVILRKPIKSKWVTIGILVPIFIVFSIFINTQRDEAQKKLYQGLNLPYKPRPHMLGSPILISAMAVSYFILRRRNKRSEVLKKEAAIDENTVMEKIYFDKDEQALGKVNKIGLFQDNKPQDISNYEGSSFKKKDESDRNFKWLYAISIIAIVIALAVFILFDKVIVRYNEGVVERTNSLKKIQEAAEQGDARAQSQLASMYSLGYGGVTQDYKEAVKWYTKSAEQGEASAQFSLGYSYNAGKGVPKDYKEAVKWYIKSAEQGNAYAQFSLGYKYKDGEGVSKSFIEAYKWFNLAAANGEESARNARDELMNLMTPKQIADGQRLSREFTPKIGIQK